MWTDMVINDVTFSPKMKNVEQKTQSNLSKIIVPTDVINYPSFGFTVNKPH